LCPLAIPHGDLLIGEIHIFHTQAHTFHETQTRPVEQTRHETGRATELCQEGLHVVSRKNRRDPFRAFGALDAFEIRKRLFQHLAIEKDQSI
jgi:hypothetical protein